MKHVMKREWLCFGDATSSKTTEDPEGLSGRFAYLNQYACGTMHSEMPRETSKRRGYIGRYSGQLPGKNQTYSARKKECVRLRPVFSSPTIMVIRRLMYTQKRALIILFSIVFSMWKRLVPGDFFFFFFLDKEICQMSAMPLDVNSHHLPQFRLATILACAS